jgi:ABC-type antimicrobial peptide transport system permease subunit
MILNRGKIRQKLSKDLLSLFLTTKFWRWLLATVKTKALWLWRDLLSFTAFFILIFLFLVQKVIGILWKTPLKFVLAVPEKIWQAKLKKYYDWLLGKIDRPLSSSQTRRSYLISLAYQNMSIKRNRFLVTIGGMAVGIGAIVFLVSLGYGLEKLVISRVARLDDLRMADVSPGESTSLRLNQEVMKRISQTENVKDVVPVISVVGRVSFKQAITDVLAYAVPKKYFDYSSVRPTLGNVYQNNAVDWQNKVAGVKTEIETGKLGEKITDNKIHFNIDPQEAVLVWEDNSISSNVLGYAVRVEGGYLGEEYWGGSYYSSNNKGREAYDPKEGVFLGRWLKARVVLYQKTAEDKLIPLLDDLGRPRWVEGWLMEKNVQVLDRYHISSGQVLGEVTTATGSGVVFEPVTTATNSSGIEWVEIKTASASAKKQEQVVDFEEPPEGEAVVSTGMLRLFNIDSSQKAVGEKFKVSFVIVKSLMPEVEGKVLSEQVEYRIVGVVNDDLNPYFYVPFVDLLKVGVANFSQLRVVAADKNVLPEVRKKIEFMGFRTSSTVDTVAQIESLFGNFRILLGFLGTVALAVAILGMFNTLTVSLLERTREIGGMKAMGMVSREVRDLFLAEAMIISFSGGVLGLVLGFLSGKTLSFFVSVFSLIKGQGYLDLTFIPPFFVVFILLASFVLGVLTGIYPARRATKISALDALRYE